MNNVFAHGAVFGINTSSTCPANPYGVDGLQIDTAGNVVADGQHATWQANAPRGLMIVGARFLKIRCHPTESTVASSTGEDFIAGACPVVRIGSGGPLVAVSTLPFA